MKAWPREAWPPPSGMVTYMVRAMPGALCTGFFFPSASQITPQAWRQRLLTLKECRLSMERSQPEPEGSVLLQLQCERVLCQERAGRRI